MSHRSGSWGERRTDFRPEKCRRIRRATLELRSAAVRIAVFILFSFSTLTCFATQATPSTKKYDIAAGDKNQTHFLTSNSNESHTKLQLTPKEQAWLKAYPEISVGGLADLVPFNFVDKDGQYEGIVHDYLNLVSEKTGLNFSVHINDWNNILQKLRDKQIDVIGGAYYTDERSQFAFYSKPFFEVYSGPQKLDQKISKL